MPVSPGSGSSGSVSRTVGPWDPEESTAWNTIRIAITIRASLRNAPYDFAHGALLFRAVTTNPVTTRIRISGTGFCVRLAAAASPSDHNHQAAGCRCLEKVIR
jgi:hypothetical protein